MSPVYSNSYLRYVHTRLALRQAALANLVGLVTEDVLFDPGNLQHISRQMGRDW